MVGGPGPLFTHVRPKSALAMAASAGRPRRLTRTPHPLLTGAVASGHGDGFIGSERDSKPLRALPPEWQRRALYHCTSHRLFNIYVNDLSKEIKDCFLIQYANDIQFLQTDTTDSLPQLVHNTEQTRTKIKHYFSKNGLLLNSM